MLQNLLYKSPEELLFAVRELQNLKVAVLAGAASATKIDVAAIRQHDTILTVLEFAKSEGAVTGITDRTSATTIVDVRASGTLTVGEVEDGETATVRGITYTFKEANADPLKNQVLIGEDEDASAANLAKQITLYDGNNLSAVANAAVVKITANSEGAGPNDWGLVGDDHITASGSKLSGGTTTGGITISAATTGSQIILAYFDKPAA